MNILQIAAQIATGLAVTFLILQWGRNSGRKEAERELLAGQAGLVSEIRRLAEIAETCRWHYPEGGEMPEVQAEVLICCRYGNGQYKTFGFWNGQFWDTRRGDMCDKEIVA